MIRSLIIRQVFRILDFALVLAVIGAGGFAARQFLSPMPTVELDEALLTMMPIETASVVRRPEDRTTYNALVKSGLFGAAGRWDPNEMPVSEPEPEIEIQEEIAESTLSLQLKGTIALEPGDPFSVAFIEDLENRDPPRSFLIGQEVVEDVTLELVYQREVILLNMRNDPPQRERLRMEDNNNYDGGSFPGRSAQMAGARRPAPVRSQPASPSSAQTAHSDSSVERITVNREELIQEVFENYTSLSTVRPELYRDDSGNVLGMTAQNIGQQPLARKLGFQDNDVLQTVNNERIDSEERIMEVLQRYQNANSFRVGILRDGKPRILNFRLD